MALIVRTGPRNRTRFLLWHTDDNRIESGHWLKGRIAKAALSPNGRYIAYGAIDARGNQYGAVSRAPWATALLFVQTGHCMGSIPNFYEDGNVEWGTPAEIEWRASKEDCPFQVFQNVKPHPAHFYPNRSVIASYRDRDGGRIEIDGGRITVDGTELIDTDSMTFEPIVPPAWALEW